MPPPQSTAFPSLRWPGARQSSNKLLDFEAPPQAASLSARVSSPKGFTPSSKAGAPRSVRAQAPRPFAPGSALEGRSGVGAEQARRAQTEDDEAQQRAPRLRELWRAPRSSFEPLGTYRDEVALMDAGGHRPPFHATLIGGSSGSGHSPALSGTRLGTLVPSEGRF